MRWNIWPIVLAGLLCNGASFAQELIFLESFSTDGDGTRYDMFGRGSDTSPDAWDHTFALAQSETFPLGPGGDITLAAPRIAIPWQSSVEAPSDDAIPFFDAAVNWATNGQSALNVSFLVNDNPSSGNMGPGDSAAQSRLGSLGHTVNLFSAASITPESLSSTDLLIVSDSVNTSDIYKSINIREVDVPVVNYSTALADDLLLSTDGGSVQSLQSIDIQLPSNAALPTGLTAGQNIGLSGSKTDLPEYGTARPGVMTLATYQGPFARSIGGLATVDAMIDGVAGSLQGVDTFEDADVTDDTAGIWSVDNPIPLPADPSFTQAAGSLDQYAIVGRGTISVAEAGDYVMGIGGDDGGRLRINGDDVIVDDTFHGFQYKTAQVNLPAGDHEIEWVGFEGGGGSGFELSFVPAADFLGDANADFLDFGDVVSTFSDGITLQEPGIEVTSYFIAPELGPDVPTDRPAILAAQAGTTFSLPAEPFENASGDYLLGTDMDSIPNAEAPPGVVTFKPINLSGVADPKLTLDVAATFGLEEESGFTEGVTIFVESGNTFEEYVLTPNEAQILENPATGQVFDTTFTSVTFDLPAGLGETIITIEVGNDSSGEAIGIDEVRITDGSPDTTSLKVRPEIFENRIQQGSRSVVAGRESADPYTGLEDTEIRFSEPDADLSEKLFLNPDGSDGGGEVHGLTKFNDLIGDGDNQIPADANIESATLNINITGPGTPLSLHRMLLPWEDESATWNEFSGGVQANDEEAKAEPDDVQTANTGLTSWDVTETLKAWQDDPESNFGWVMLPLGTNGVDYLSAEAIALDTSGLAVAPFIEFTLGELGCVIPDGVLAGDLDQDGTVAFADFLIMSNNFGQEVDGYSQGDVDCNGSVAFADFLLLSDNFGQSSAAQAVPEPNAGLLASMALIIGLCLRRRRS